MCQTAEENSPEGQAPGWIFSSGGFLHPQMHPDKMTDTERPAKVAAAKRNSIALHRVAGFRRVGDSPYFCFALERNHRSRALPKDGDHHPPALTELRKGEDAMDETRCIQTSFGISEECSGDFTGFHNPVLEKWFELKGIPDPWESEDWELLARAKYGCTCGQCLRGFVSPRMLLSMESATEENFENDRIDAGYYTPEGSTTLNIIC